MNVLGFSLVAPQHLEPLRRLDRRASLGSLRPLHPFLTGRTQPPARREPDDAA